MSVFTRLFGLRAEADNGPDFAVAGRNIALFGELVAAGLVTVAANRRRVYVVGELWAGKDQRFRENWMKNAYVYCRLKYPFIFKEHKLIEFHVLADQGESPALPFLSATFDGMCCRFFM